MSLYVGPDWSSLAKDGTFDLNPSFGLLSDPYRIVVEHILRRWIVQPGELDDANIGAGLNQWLNGNLTISDFDELAAKLRSSALDVDGVADIQLQITLDAKENLTITASISLDDSSNFPTIFSLSDEGAIQLIVDGQSV